MQRLATASAIAVLFSATPALAVLNGPAGAPCSGTLNGQPYSGVQTWSTYQGHGYWACATRGTAAFANPRPAPTNARSAAPPPRPVRGEVELRDADDNPVIIRR